MPTAGEGSKQPGVLRDGGSVAHCLVLTVMVMPCASPL